MSRRIRRREVLEQQQGGEEQADEDNETGGGGEDAEEFDGGPLRAQIPVGMEGGFVGETGAFLPLRKKNGGRTEPRAVLAQGLRRVGGRHGKATNEDVVADDGARRQQGAVADEGAFADVVFAGGDEAVAPRGAPMETLSAMKLPSSTERRSGETKEAVETSAPSPTLAPSILYQGARKIEA